MTRLGPRGETWVAILRVRSPKKNRNAVKMLRKMNKRHLRRLERHKAKEATRWETS